MKYEANDCGNSSFVHSETRTIILRTVNPSLYENKTLITSWVAISTTRSALAVSKHGFAIDSNGKNRGFKSPMSQSLEKKICWGEEGLKGICYHFNYPKLVHQNNNTVLSHLDLQSANLICVAYLLLFLFSEDRRTANVIAEPPGVECLVVERT